MGMLPVSGALIIGEKGKLFSPDDYGARFFVAMKGQEEFIASDKHDACKDVRKPSSSSGATIAKAGKPDDSPRKHFDETPAAPGNEGRSRFSNREEIKSPSGLTSIDPGPCDVLLFEERWAVTPGAN